MYMLNLVVILLMLLANCAQALEGPVKAKADVTETTNDKILQYAQLYQIVLDSQNKIQNLEIQFQYQNQQMNMLENLNEKQAKQIHTLENLINEIEIQNKQQISQNHQQMKNIEKQTTKLNILENQNKKLINEISNIDNQNSEVMTEMNELNLQMERVTNNLKSCAVDNSSVVSFAAYATQDRDYDVGAVVQFESIIRNYGSSYEPSSGIFICPKNGYYLFSSSIRSVSDSNLEVGIVVDGEEIIHVYSHGTDLDQGTSLAVTYCNFGRQAFVRVVYDAGTIDGNSNKVSSFSGTLLFEVM